MLSLRGVFDRVERAFAETVVEWVDSPVIAEAFFEAGKVGVIGQRRLGELRSSAVHVLSLPSHRDVRMLSAQVARLQTALAEVEAQLEDLRLGAPAGADLWSHR
jgi:hypothetical protein